MADRPLISPRRRALLVAAGASLLAIRAAPVPPVDGAHALRLGKLLLPGDVVFRSGLSVESSAVLGARAHSRFSHVGIVAPTRDGLRVVHALPADDAFGGEVVSSTWAEFAVAPDVRAIGIFGAQGVTTRERDRIAAEALRLLGMPFNAALALDDTRSLYCTQLALRALSQGDPSVKRYVRPTSLAFLAAPVYLPDSLLDWPRLVELGT